MIKKIVVIFLIFIIMATCSGCWDQKELDQIGFVVGVGIDWDKQKHRVKVVGQIIKPGEMQSAAAGGGVAGGSGGGGGGKEPTFVIETDGQTVFKAIRSATFKNSRRLNFTHNEILIIGKAAGEHGISPLLDFFVRDPEPRPTQLVLYTEQDSKKVLEAKPPIEKAAAVEIRKMVDNYIANSEVMRVQLQDLLEMLMSESRSATLPIVGLEKTKSGPKPVLNGTAIFRRDKFKGKLDRKQTRGLLWVLGRVKSGIIEIPLTGEQEVAVEIIVASGRFKPLMKRGKLMMQIEVKVEGNIGGQMSAKDMSATQEINKLERLIESSIRGEILSTVKKAKSFKTDIFGFGEAVNRSYPKAWKSMEPQWEKLFPNVSVNIKVKAIVRQLGETTKPLH